VSPPARRPDFPPVTFGVRVNDPSRLLKGNWQARLTPEGLKLRSGKKQVELPVGTPAEYLDGNRLALAYEHRRLKLTVGKPFHYQNRLARDVAAFLNGEKDDLRAADYHLPLYLLLPAVLPLGIPILTLGGGIPAVVGAVLAAGAAAVATRETWAPALRIAVALLFSVVGYAALLAVVVWPGLLPWPWSGRIAASQWKEFTPPDKSFRLLLPGQPKDQSQTLATPFGPLLLKILSVGVGSNEYGVGYLDLPPQLAAQPLGPYLTSVRDGIIRSYEGKVQSERIVQHLGSNMGREFSFEMKKPRGTGAARIFRVENRLYQLLVVGRWLSPESEDVQKFFDSLTLTPASPPVPPPQKPPVIQYLERLKSGDAQALNWLRQLYPGGKEEAIPGLTEALKNSKFTVHVADILLRYDPGNAAALAALRPALKDPDVHNVIMAARDLLKHNPEDPEARAALLRIIKEQKTESVPAAAALGELGPPWPEAAPDLVTVFEGSKDKYLRGAVLGALARVDPKAAMPHLIRCLKSPEFGLQIWAANLLGAIGPQAKEAVPALQEVIATPASGVRRNDPYNPLHSAAKDALDKIQGK
jgi:hypothetical protein